MECFIDNYTKLFIVTTFLCVLITKKISQMVKLKTCFAHSKFNRKKKQMR